MTTKQSTFTAPWMNRILPYTLVAGLFVTAIAARSVAQPANDTDNGAVSAFQQESTFLANIRQLTFEGRRAGEGYFSRDGSKLVFQSERKDGNPFFQIYWMDLETGDTERVSPGIGKTTCAWIHPNGRKVLFASTHEDPRAEAKQQDELKMREAGEERRYSWDYDEYYDIYEFTPGGGEYKNLTQTVGYDAEGSWSPDGSLIAFASNRQAYRRNLLAEEREHFERDPAFMMDIYIMNADGSNVRQLTDAPGYDGGPFFSPDGNRICWRRFSEDGATAEIMTMNVDGSDQGQLTSLGAMSWAPFYHPSGEYLVFTTNRHGFANFELYLVDRQGAREPLRVTYTNGFDGLPSFSPDGRQLAWTSNRTANRQSQIFLANWDHLAALDHLKGKASPADPELAADAADAATTATESARQTTAEFSPQDILRHVDYLCRPELQGRLTGTKGEKLATAYVAAYMHHVGLAPAGDDGTFFQEFEFTAGVALGDNNLLRVNREEFNVDAGWRPVSFSATGDVEPAPLVFAGYGIVAPSTANEDEYDSYIHLDVKDKWVLVFRYLPEDITPRRRQHLSRHASLRYKAMVARDKGAKGLIVVTGPSAKVNEQLIPLQFDGSLSGTSLPVISVTDEFAAQWLKNTGKNLKNIQDELDSGALKMGFEVEGLELSSRIDIEKISQSGRNVLGRLQIAEKPAEQAVLVGAHIDHLGKGAGSSSLARNDEKDQIHFGADDNASGVAAMLEIAEYLVRQNEAGSLSAERDIIFAAWSGEELGLIGSSHFANRFAEKKSHHGQPDAVTNNALYPKIAACLNLDMVGRLDEKLILQGVGSSDVWRSEIERRNAPIGLALTIQDDSYLPTDASTFFTKGVPILSAFTGTHDEYHTPRDTPEKLNYEGAAQVARLMALITRSLAMREEPPEFIPQLAHENLGQRANLRAYLGTVPDYAGDEVQGLRLSGVAANGPAASAGLTGGDVIVELAGRKIENIYDYTYAIEALKIGEPVNVSVLRDEKRIELEITPGSRD